MLKPIIMIHWKIPSTEIDYQKDMGDSDLMKYLLIILDILWSHLSVAKTYQSFPFPDI